MRPRTMVLLFLYSLGGALLAEEGGQESDWKQSWAGSTINRALAPVGKTVLLEGFESTAVEAVGQAASAADNYRFSSRAPQLRMIPDAKDGGGAGMIVSEGTDFGMFASSREGWKQLHLSVKRGVLSACTGIRFWMRANEGYDALNISITESGPPMGPGGAPRSHRAAIDVPGDGQWHEVVIPFYGNVLRTSTPVDAEAVNRISFTLPYHRAYSLSIDKLEAFRAVPGAVPLPVLYPLTDVSDGAPGASGAAAAPQRTNIPELKAYEKAALAAQELSRARDTAAQALASAQEAQRALLKYVEQFRETRVSERDTYSYQRAMFVLNYVLWANQIEIDRLKAWQQHPDGEMAWQSGFMVDHYRDYPVELSYIAYWSQGLRITGILAKPKGPGRWPLLLVNHGRGSFSKDHMAQILTPASSGFVVLASDYRGQGEAEGRESSASASAMDVVNGARAVMKLPYVDGARIGMWGHSMGGTVSWQVLASDFGKQVRAYTQISSFPSITDEQLKQIRCPVFMVAGTVGSLEERIVKRLPGAVERLTKAGVPFEVKIYPGYSHHAMKYGEALTDALAFLRKHVM